VRLVPSYDSGRQQVVITRNEEKADRAEGIAQEEETEKLRRSI